MIANYHTHTARCCHAIGTEREYVENAIARGLKIFGFSDHTPQYFPGDYYSYMRMRPYELPEYCADVRHLQREFRDQIQILLGMEVEYYPACWSQLQSRLRDAGVDYMILGQHWLGNEENEDPCLCPTADEQRLRRYCCQVMEALETGKFTYFAHPDVLNFTGDRDIYRKLMREVIRTAKQTDTPLEINFVGIRSGRHYPSETLFELVAEEDCPVVFGLDAHAPEHVLDSESEEKALEMVHRLGLNLLETVPLKPL